MTKILIIGGGYAGFYTAWGLERRLRPGEAEVTVVDPRPYMTYQPFLPEVAAGSVEPRHTVVSLRRHLARTRVLAGSVVELRHAERIAVVRPAVGPDRALAYDVVVVTAGAVTRTFPVAGVQEEAIGLKTVEEGVAVRDALLGAFDRASVLEPGPERRRTLSVTVVGGGFTGVELFGELLSLATAQLKKYPMLGPDDLDFHLVEAAGRILPEVSDEPGRWVVRQFEERGGRVHLGTQLRSAVDRHIVLSTGEEYDTGLLVWAAGNASNPVAARHTDLPTDARGLITVKADLRVVDTESGHVVEDAWAAGDDAAVPDLVLQAERPDARTVPNAQHAVRQGRLLAENLVRALRGERPRPYRHRSLGVVATLGLGTGVFQYRGIVVKGLLGWVMHRGYHVLAVPTWERKVRVLLVWLSALLFGRDVVSLPELQHPRRAFATGGAPREETREGVS
ncbi:FAD-dependent oxidoreductase [Herbiconiux sp. KACC 21604]|uniref:NAD(P)/FAD-dependent oxidoreductase n=1 Tax=unclassified Herbiconiux TaxID=2618217 RepID=UPI001490B68F|nr:FAD-dependent oxidoreductase [Herbiconiux sp. SALV-R1]QJU55194.1 FAD-dependent oxidoreductase [Herbiconiux sp. SALV-R1]WPO86358.1 FAD-dependent oxidoreductase [Herbiconiux sp. KACC 21604]